MLNKEEFAKDLEKWITSYTNAYCNKAADLLTQQAKLCILNFYNSYNPLYYYRTDDLLNNSYKRYKHNNGKYVYGGVRISANEMQSYKKTSAKTVLGMTFFHGYHGEITKEYDDSYYYIGKHYSYPPIYMLEYYMNDKNFHNCINQYAISIAKKQDYSILSKIL